MAARHGEERSAQRASASAASAGEDEGASTRELIIELALTESAIRNAAAAGDPPGALAQQEDALITELHGYGVGFHPLGPQAASAPGPGADGAEDT